jgi:hypothetical protein
VLFSECTGFCHFFIELNEIFVHVQRNLINRIKNNILSLYMSKKQYIYYTGIGAKPDGIHSVEESCIICMRLLLASGIRKIYYIHDYKNDELVTLFADLKNVQIYKL